MSQPNSNSGLTKATLLLVSTLTVMAGATIAPSLPAMQEHFSEVNNAALWVRLVLTLPALFIVIGSLLAGVVVDRFGRKPLLLAAAALYGLAGASGYVFDSLFHILVGRAFLGFAVAGIMVTATTLIADYYSGAARATFLGLQAAFMGLGGVLFLSLGGFLADQNWRFPFLIYLFAWLLVPLIAWAISEPQRAASAVPKAAINSGIQDSTPGSRPAFPVKLLVFICGIALLTQIIFYLIPVQLPFYLKELANANASQSGLAIALATLFSAMSSLFYGKIKQRLGFFSILVLVFGLMGAGYSIIGLVHSYALVLVGLAIAGAGLGLLMPTLNLWIASEVSDAARGRALGGSTTFFFLGQFLSPLVSQPLSKVVGLSTTYALAGGLMLVCGLALMALQRPICKLIATKAA
ncbi:MAG: MFS transporter [Tildeniella nuda ZEHNDER 1965/U140]|jgi:MFS family permease|nr:MFS transporter [Tildeniella nuda ZEHNDER 1965/U140]